MQFGLALEDVVINVTQSSRRRARELQSGSLNVAFQLKTKETSAGSLVTSITSTNASSLSSSLGVTVTSAPTAPELLVVEWPPPPPSIPPSPPHPEQPTSAAILAQKQAMADAAKIALNADFKKALSSLQLNSTGVMVELDISAGVLDADFLRPYLTFSPATTASEVILTGKGADPFDPFFGMVVVGGGRRLGHWPDAASVTMPGRAGYSAIDHPLEGGMVQGPTLSGSGQGGTSFSGLPVTVLGGNNAPAVQLNRMRFENNGDEPAVYVHDLGRLIVQDCIFDKNAVGAIRLLSGALEVAFTSFTNNGGLTVRGGALQLLGGTAVITQSIFEGNNASEGGAIFIEGAEVALGNRTTLRNNRADLGSVGVNNAVPASTLGAAQWGPTTIYDGLAGRPKKLADTDKFYQDAGTTPSTPNYVASELHGNSLYCVNGTLRYILPAPLGHWIGPARESEVLPLGLIGTESLSVVVKANNQVQYNPLNRRIADQRLSLVSDFRIDEDYPYRCLPGYFRERDTPESQDGPQCESVCPGGAWCPEGTASPFPCFTASYCPEGSEYPTPCPKGTWTNRTDLVSAWDCEPCPPGHYCPLNTSVPIECGIGTYAPTSGHFKCQLCPIGYFQEVLGQWNCSSCIDGFYCPLGTTIEPCFPGEYRDLTTGQCVKAPLGFFAALGATQPTECSAGSHADVTGLLKCKLCPFGKYMENRNAIVCKPCMLGFYCPIGSTGGTVCKPGTIRLEIGAGSQDNCTDAPRGTFGLGGFPNPCPIGFYQDQVGTDSEQDCIRCPEYSTTYEVGQGDITQCFCQNGFIEDLSTGARKCMCEVGEGIKTTADAEVCDPCEIGSYKDTRGNVRCTLCQFDPAGPTVETATTSSRGSTSITDCVCKIGFYKAKVLSANGTYEVSSSSRRPWQFKDLEFPALDLVTMIKPDPTQERWDESDEYSCFPCSSLWEIKGESGTNCTYIGIDIQNIPLLPGYYRERNISRVVRYCELQPTGCKGGSDVTDQCVEQQRGPFCGICAIGYFTSGDGLCVQCTGDETLTIALPVGSILTFLFVFIIGYRKFSAWSKRLIMEKLPMGVDVLSGEDPEDVWAAQMEKVRQELGEERPRTFGTLQYLNRKSKSMGIRFKIILSLMQVMNGVSTCFVLKFPPLFSFSLKWLSIITFVEIDLPKLMPMACLFEVNYFTSLLSKTLFPLLFIMGLFLFGFIASKVCAGAKDSADWDMDADGEIDRDEFMQAQPQGKFISDLCNSIGFFLIFLLYPSATVATFQFFVCDQFNGEGESGFRFLTKDYLIDCEGQQHTTWRIYIWGMIFIYPIGVPIYYIANLFINRHHLGRLRRFQIEQEDIAREKAARRNTISELTITEFERQELMRLLEEAEVERVEKKQEHLERTLPTAVKKLTNGYTWKCYWFEIFECVRKVALIGIPVVFPAGGIEQRTWGLIVCFLASIIIAQLQPYGEVVDQQLAILCQFQVFFCVIAGQVLEEDPTNVIIDATLTIMLTIITLFAFLVDFLDGESMEDMFKLIVFGADDPESEGAQEVAQKEAQNKNKKKNKPREPKPWDPVFAALVYVLQLVFGTITKFLFAFLRFLDRCLGVVNPTDEMEAEREKRRQLHPELQERHRLDSWNTTAAKELLTGESAFAAVLDETEAEQADLEEAMDEDNMMSQNDKLDRLLESRGEAYGPPATGFAAVRRGTSGGGGGGGGYGGVGSSREVEAFLNPERVGIEIAIGDLKKSAKAASKRAAKSLSVLVQSVKEHMGHDLKKLAADWPVVTPRGRHLTERYVPTGRSADAKENLEGAAKEVFEVQRELRGIAFLTGAEMGDPNIPQGRDRPTDAASWKTLVGDMSVRTRETATSLRLLQKVLDTFPDDDDMTNVLRATPEYHPHRQLITQLGLAAGSCGSNLRLLLSLAVAAGASSDVAPWSASDQLERDLKAAFDRQEREKQTSLNMPTAMPLPVPTIPRWLGGGGQSNTGSEMSEDGSRRRLVGARVERLSAEKKAQLDLRIAAAAKGSKIPGDASKDAKEAQDSLRGEEMAMARRAALRASLSSRETARMSELKGKQGAQSAAEARAAVRAQRLSLRRPSTESLDSSILGSTNRLMGVVCGPMAPPSAMTPTPPFTGGRTPPPGRDTTPDSRRDGQDSRRESLQRIRAAQESLQRL